MEKLIELLDEYRKQNPREFFGDDGSLVVLTGKDFIELNRLLIISKSYGFIQWLYDKGFAYWESAGLLEDLYVDEYSDRKSTVVDATIMKLSIEDEPIIFLISILK